MPLSAKLVVVGGEVKTAEIKLRLPSTIGRGRGATIMLPHPLVSRTHCELFESDGRLMVRDLGSLNGTFINNQRITEAPLPAGELLTVGTVTFRAVYETGEEPAGPPPGPGPVMKTRAHDTDLNATLRANPPASSSSKTPAAPMEVEFNFGQPLVNFDEEDDAGPPTPKPQAPTKPDASKGSKGGEKETERSEAAIEDVPMFEEADDAPSTKPGPKPAPAAVPLAKPAPPAAVAPIAKPAAAPAAAPAPSKDSKPAVESKWKDDDEPVGAAAEEDDDFNDFLKSLDGK